MDFVKKNKYVDNLYIHCNVGVSRSPGVATAICKYYLDDDFMGFRTYNPNMHVYTEILNEFMRQDREKDVETVRFGV